MQKRINNDNQDFLENNFNKLTKGFVAFFVVTSVISVGTLGFLGWAIYRLVMANT